MISFLKRSLIAILSAGWLVPAFLGLKAYLDFWQAEGLPRLRGEHPINSFPFLHFVQQCLTVSVVWLGVAILYWSWKLSGQKRNSNQLKSE